MKKEIKTLLEQEEGRLDLNSMFYLKRWILKKDTDILGRDEEHLAIEMNTRYKSSRAITSRDISGIMQEIKLAMVEMMDEYRDDLVKRFSGGEINKYL